LAYSTEIRRILGVKLPVLRRAVIAKRVVANNVRIRRAAELLDSSYRSRSACKILQDTLEPLGFSGFRWEELKDRRRNHPSIHALRLERQDPNLLGQGNDPQIRLGSSDSNLTTRKGLQLGYRLSIPEYTRTAVNCLSGYYDRRGPNFNIDALQRTIPNQFCRRQVSTLDQPKELASRLCASSPQPVPIRRNTQPRSSCCPQFPCLRVAVHLPHLSLNLPSVVPLPSCNIWQN